METEPAALLARTMVIVAHPDDDVIGCGVLLQRMREPLVLFCTDGAPRAPEYWTTFECRERYGEIRQHEARAALAQLGITPMFLTHSGSSDCFVDQDLFLAVPNALSRILALIDFYQPTALLAHAYEGGHPDHDSCCFLAHQAGLQRNLPVWEFPLYHRTELGEFKTQKFLWTQGGEVFLSPASHELERKQQMVACHASQRSVLRQFDPARECFRTMPNYDYSLPPHPGVTNYEAWGWPVTSKQLCAAFNACQQRHSPLQPFSTSLAV